MTHSLPGKEPHMCPFEYLEFLQNAYSISKSTFLEVGVGPLHTFIHWRNVASLARSICFRSLFGLRWASGEGLCSGPEVLPVMPLGTCDSWILSRSSPWNDYRGWGQHSLHRHHRWGAREERLQQPLDAKRVPLNSFSKLSLWISWTLVEVDYSKWWLFQAFFTGSVNTLLPIKATQPHPATTAVYLVGFKLCVTWVHLCTSWCLVLNVFLTP